MFGTKWFLRKHLYDGTDEGVGNFGKSGKYSGAITVVFLLVPRLGSSGRHPGKA